MKHLLWLAFAVLLSPLSGHATSVARSAAQALNAEPYCELDARYLGEHVPADIVYWRFTAQGAVRAVGAIDCAPVVQSLELRIFGAKKSARLGKVVYPEYVPTAEPSAIYRLQVIRRARDEWTVRNWREGFVKAGN